MEERKEGMTNERIEESKEGKRRKKELLESVSLEEHKKNMCNDLL